MSRAAPGFKPTMPNHCDWRELARFVQARLPSPDASIGEETPLLSSDLIDSFTLIELVVYVQTTFGVTIPPARLTLQDFDTLGRISRLVESLKPDGEMPA